MGTEPLPLKLSDGSRIGVIGGGPAGSFFSYFFLEMARRMELQVSLDIYEPRNFSVAGPGGCNMCGGIVSESLVQNLASEGITLPESVVQRTINSYALHMDVGSVTISTPLQEKRIASVHRGGGPRGQAPRKFGGLDGHLLGLAVKKGARVVNSRVERVERQDGHLQLIPAGGPPASYDFVAVASGVNSPARMLEPLHLAYRPPRTTKTYICEYCFGRDLIRQEMGTSMHVFLLNLPRLEFAALIPKGDYVTLCLLGRDLDRQLVQSLLDTREMKEVLPANWKQPEDYCHCSPKISTDTAVEPFADRLVFIGDCGTTRLYKDGIGAAYRTAKAAAKTAIFKGIAAEDFRRHYWPVCRQIHQDNLIGRLVFAVTRLIQGQGFARRGIWRMVSKEQQTPGSSLRMSTILWDTFTGSAPYKSVLRRALHPGFLARLLWEMLAGFWVANHHKKEARAL
ncbi:MAG TPA: hypothetical protein VMS96_08075 [Terriglobales bacterium]|nr:hypothetical protein [Terriglobales bacterium]